MPTLDRERARRGERWRMQAGDDLRVEVEAGDMVEVDSGVGAAQEVAGEDGVAVFSGLAEGVHWVLVRRPGEDARRLGSVSVEPLADREEVRMRKEIADLDARILSRESKDVSVSGDGFSLNRIGIQKLHQQRSKIQSQLRSYLRQRSGRGPTTWQR